MNGVDPATDVFAVHQATWRVGAAVAQLRDAGTDPRLERAGRLLAEAQALLLDAAGDRGLVVLTTR